MIPQVKKTYGMSIINAGITLSQQYLEHLLNLCQEELKLF